jgi:putative phosphoribosyl transferase
MMFRDRVHAGEQLGDRLRERISDFCMTGDSTPLDAVVLGLPRGGVPVAREVAKKLGLPLDILVVRKIGMPGHEELALGAVTSAGVEYINEDLIDRMQVDPVAIQRLRSNKKSEVDQRESIFMAGRKHVDLANKCVILVDDGLATGASMKAAVQAVRSKHPTRVVVAVPVAASDAVRELRGVADFVVCLTQPEFFYGVGGSYHVFAQTSDEEVLSILRGS